MAKTLRQEWIEALSAEISDAVAQIVHENGGALDQESAFANTRATIRRHAPNPLATELISYFEEIGDTVTLAKIEEATKIILGRKQVTIDANADINEGDI